MTTYKSMASFFFPVFRFVCPPSSSSIIASVPPFPSDLTCFVTLFPSLITVSVFTKLPPPPPKLEELKLKDELLEAKPPPPKPANISSKGSPPFFFFLPLLEGFLGSPKLSSKTLSKSNIESKSANGSLPPKKSLKTSFASLKPPKPPKPPNGSPPPPPPPPAPPLMQSLPQLSYRFRVSGSDRTSYASATSRNFFSASSLLSGFLSGCHRMASLRYAFLMAAVSALLSMPSTS
mmetsp:Transcript_34518/g.78822  ORF Transcript_34518/g.78822 Transcript_34518/m.78822 type:complete len:234 (-) Transcript_34518:155-856(-)